VNFVVSNSVDGFVILDLHGQTKAGPFKLKNWAQTRATRMNDALTDTVGPDAKLRVDEVLEGYVVMAGDEIIVSGPYDTEMKARVQIKNIKAKAAKRAHRRERPCMSCKRVFSSEGIHNRLCDNCRHKSEGMI